MAKSTSTKIEVATAVLYATPTGIKTKPSGKVLPAGAVLATLAKGDRRKARKAMHRAGLVGHAAARPVPA